MEKQWQALPSNKHEIVGIAVTFLQQCQSWSCQNLTYSYRQRRKMRKKILEKKCPQTIFLFAGNKRQTRIFPTGA